ncbi:hypothetical protein EV178_006244 [Coemansia sp. RSA 1646]|nr:hypothetical protein EV178_006244 [Coemansia sp. RSA 1646]
MRTASPPHSPQHAPLHSPAPSSPSSSISASSTPPAFFLAPAALHIDNVDKRHKQDSSPKIKLACNLIQTIRVTKTLTMSGDQGASVYQLEEASRALATLCNSISAENEEDSMTLEQQAKRRRTESRATDTESPAPDGSPTVKVSPSVSRAMSVTHSLPAIRSPVVGSEQHNLPQQQQQQQQYHDPAVVAGTAQPYTYSHPQQYAAQSHMPAQSSSVTTPVFNAASAMAQPHQRLFGGYTQQAPNHYGHQYLPPPPPSGHQQLNIPVNPSASVSSSASTTGAASVGVQQAHLHQQFVSPHTIPSTLLGQSPGMPGADYGVWLYPHQQIPAAANRPVALGSVSGAAATASSSAIAGGDAAASSTSVSPVSQHTLATTEGAYPIQGQFDGQMRYMAVPGQTSAVPKQVTAASYPYDRSLRPISITGQQQQAAIAAAAAAAALNDNSSGHLPPIAASPSNSGSVLHSSTYGAVHGGHSGQLSPEQVSAAQMAAAVAAVAASTHAIPASTVSSTGSVGTANNGAGRLGVGMSDIDQPGLSSFKFSVNMPSGSESGLPDYFESYTQNYMVGNQPVLEPSPASPTEQTLDTDLIARLDELFMKYLEAICSNTITVDSEGESIHQTQMAKKLEKLEQCTEYRTFRFRIQAFSNGYREFMEREAGMTEQMVSKQQLRAYLHQQRYISRYNEDGKKAKSKGHHVWNVEAKKISRNTWWFKEFLRRIASPPAKAVIGVPYEWTPTIWDPQIKSPKVYFSSEWLPSWLRWENNSLRGLAPPDATDCNIVVIASYYQGKDICHLKTNFTIHVVQHTPASTTVFMS